MIFPYSKAEPQVNSAGMEADAGGRLPAFCADDPPGDAAGEGRRAAGQQEDGAGLPGMGMLVRWRWRWRWR